jgi:general secretion pathway protein A
MPSRCSSKGIGFGGKGERSFNHGIKVPMYNSFFSFKERPFKLVPNPAFLFLSRSHEEALAHLTYAISSGDGFVLITGEVGTGKTTLCRAFLEQLDENSEAAYIFNPKLDALALLQSINDEFGIRSDFDTVKELIDELNHFLMQKRAEGKNVLLLIDEAQKLSQDVLEQLRLLSNLETSQDKLIQIILVGQPELGETLDSYDLRQLSQRITLSCHIIPLTYRETKNYIQHRINIASRKNGIPFDSAAFRAIYKYSGGVPRLVNIASERSLLTAFGLNKKRITGRIARLAIHELGGRGQIGRSNKKQILKLGGITASLLLLIIAAILLMPKWLPQNDRQLPSTEIEQPQPPAENMDVKTEPKTSAPKAPEVLETPPPEPAVSTKAPLSLSPPQPISDFGNYLRAIDPQISRSAAIKAVLTRWEIDDEIPPDLESINEAHMFFRLVAKQKGMHVYHAEGGLPLLASLNLPAILAFSLPDKLTTGYLTLYKLKEMQASGNEPSTPELRTGFLTLYELKEGSLFLKNGPQHIEIRPEDFDAYFSGSAYLLWKDFLSYNQTILLGSKRDAVITLKMHLRDMGYTEVDLSAFYDPTTQTIVQDLQQKYGLIDDGVVGPLTKIILYNEKSPAPIPHLR